jgi:hypothetical protein
VSAGVPPEDYDDADVGDLSPQTAILQALPSQIGETYDAQIQMNLLLEEIARAVERIAEALEKGPAGQLNAVPWDLPGQQAQIPQQTTPLGVPQQGVPMGGMAQPAADLGAWVCPIHQVVKTVPAGVSRKTGKPYPAFLVCPVDGCPQKPPRS